MSYEYNNNGVTLNIHRVDSENLSFVVTEFDRFFSVTINIANHDVTLFVDDKSHIDDVLAIFANPHRKGAHNYDLDKAPQLV